MAFQRVGKFPLFFSFFLNPSLRYSVATLSRCGANTFCSNNVGSYQCGCNSGLLELWEEHRGIHYLLVHWELGLNAIF